jgi:hypothetical protein
MNSKHHSLIGILILLLGLVASHVALAEVTSIDSASPDVAEQGRLDLPVTIKGSGFDKTVKEVKFLLPCAPEPCAGTNGGITVTGFTVDAEDTITATIDVSATAEPGDFFIAMATRGRGGKGTTFKSANLFTVKLRPNQQLVLCDELIEAPLGSCNCKFSWDGNENIYGLLDNCETSETLRLKSMIRTAGSVQASGTERLTITAVPCGSAPGQNCSKIGSDGFSGSSVIENWFHRARVRFIDIRFHANVSRGCDPDDIQSAISFVLRAGDSPNPDTDTPDPTNSLPEDNPDSINRNSLFSVSDMGIYSEDDPLCNAVEVIRTENYTNIYSTPGLPFLARDWKIQVTNTEISAGSYVQAGIVMLGIMPMQSINPPIVFGNQIGAAACEIPDPVGILFGDLTFDTENLIEGIVESNTINMARVFPCVGPLEPTPTGVRVVSDSSDDQTTAKVTKNTISGAVTGVKVGENVVEVNISGNTLAGDGGVGTGILSDAQCTSTKGKPNKISGYETDIDDIGCL